MTLIGCIKLESSRDLRVSGAKKLLRSAAKMGRNENLLILANESLLPISRHLTKAAGELDIGNVTLIVFPDELRPMTEINDMLGSSLEKADVCVNLVDRMPEETRLQIGPMMSLVTENDGRYIILFDPKESYFERGGIQADYGAVREKGMKVFGMIDGCESVSVSSALGTDLVFRLDPECDIQVRYPGSSFQAPEGEVQCRPIAESMNGTLVVNGAITGLGLPGSLVTYENFRDGAVEGIRGDEGLLGRLADYVSRCGGGPALNNLDTVEEFSIGINDWAILDDNISNCEKVSGTVHFGIGHRDEWPHIDHMVLRPTVVVTDSDGERVRLIEDGNLLI